MSVVIVAVVHVLLVIFLMLTVKIDVSQKGISFWLLAFLFTLGPSQGYLLAIWTTLGGNKTYWRVMIAFICVIVYTWFNVDRYVGLTPTTFVTETFNMGVVLLIARLMGLEIHRPDYSEHKKTLKPYQYTIWHLMAWTTVVAVLLSCWRYLPQGYWFDDFRFNLSRSDLSINLFIPGSFLLVTLAATWLMLGEKCLFPRIALLPSIILFSAICVHYISRSHILFNEFCVVLSSVVAWIIGSLILIRLAGYRFNVALEISPYIAKPIVSRVITGISCANACIKQF